MKARASSQPVTPEATEQSWFIPTINHLLLRHHSQSCDSTAIFVAKSGAADNPGTLSSPLGSLQTARNRIRELKASGSGVPANFTVCIRGGTYYFESPFELTTEDSNTARYPILYRNYNNEEVVLTGGMAIDPSWLAPIASSDPLWSKFDPVVRDDIVTVDLASHGIVEYGALRERGFSTQHEHSPMELSINGKLLHLTRWPNQGESDMLQTNAPAQVTGTLSPDVTGTYAYIGNSASGDADDGYPNYKREGTVNGVQYYLYHCTWQDGGGKILVYQWL